MVRKTGKISSPKQLLRNARLQRGWSQKELADRLETTAVTVKRWERGSQQPSPYFRFKLSALFGKSAQELGLLPEENETQENVSTQKVTISEKVLPPWNIPYRRNPSFTGRKEVLEHLHERLHAERATTSTHVYALCGLGGIGKTQTVIEYAYTYRHQYTAVLWVQAETQDILIDDMVALAQLLQLPEKDAHNQNHIVQAVLRWLHKHPRWLLILDNIEDLTLLRDFTPPDHDGYLLLTARTQFTSTVAERISLGPMTEQESLLLLLRRARLIAPEAPLEALSKELRTKAEAITSLMNGLPLAIDQAGAYIEETACSLTAYLTLFQEQQWLLLDRRGEIPLDHPSSVVATLMLCMHHIEQEDPVAADLLSLCAFFHPDAIPEEFLQQEICEYSDSAQKVHLDSFALNRALTVMRRYSFIHRHTETRTLSMHRLIQIVLKGQMDEPRQHHWAEQAIQIVSAAFPNVEQLTTWSQCQHYLPHAYTCIEAIDQWHLSSPEAVQLLKKTSAYLREQAQESKANALAERLAVIHQHSFEPSSPDLITNFFSFMRHAYYQGIYHATSALIREQVENLEQTLGSDHPDMIYLRIGQAFLFQMEGKYFQAEEMYQHTLTMENVTLLYQRMALSEEMGDAGPPHVGFVLSLLGQLYTALGHYQQAEAYFQQSGAVWDQYTNLAPHLFKGPYLHGFALLLLIEHQEDMAHDLLQQEQALLEEILGEDHPIRADNDNAQTRLALARGEYIAAERFLQHAKAIFERTTGLNHPFAVQTFHLWAQLHLKQKNLEQAEALCLQAIHISETSQGPDHPETASCLKTLADIFFFQSRWSEAELFYQRVLALDEKTLGTTHPHYRETLECYVNLIKIHKAR